MNDLVQYANILDDITPWSGNVPAGFLVDSLGILTDIEFRRLAGDNPQCNGGNFQETQHVAVNQGEGWFEAANWVMAAREAKDRFTMVTLGACYGAQAVGAYKAVQILNPVPCKLVAVEPMADNVALVKKHFADNGIDPNDHWILNVTLSDSNKTVLFPDGAPASGAQNCVSTNLEDSRRNYVNAVLQHNMAPTVVENLIMSNSTGIMIDLVPGMDLKAELKFLSAITLADVLGPFDFVDYVESDIQQSEIIVFPPAIQALNRKVRRVHIGTHGGEVHSALRDMFVEHGWELVFDYAPNQTFETEFGTFETNDGVLTVVNPRF